MKLKLTCIIFLVCIALLQNKAVYGDSELNDSSANLDINDQYIENIYNSDTAPEKANIPVTDQEFNTAIRNKEKFGLPYHRRKELEKKRKIEEQIEKEKEKALHVNPTPLALISIPVATRINDEKVIAGFYLLDYKLDAEKEYILIKQADQIIGTVPVYESVNQEKKVNESYAEIKSFEDTRILVELNTKVARISFYLDRFN